MSSCNRSSSLRRWVPVAIIVVVAGCTAENPLDDIRARFDRYPEYSVVLDDMRETGNFRTECEHRYQVVYAETVPAKGRVSAEDVGEDPGLDSWDSDWRRIDCDLYRRYDDYLGMTIFAKEEGQAAREDVRPAGYRYVGDTRYGRWRERDGGSFWEFYGKYALMSHLFSTFRQPVGRGEWDGYRTARSSGRPYFGSRRQHGTAGSYTRQTRPTFYERQSVRQARQREGFSRKVDNRVRRSRMSGTRSRSGGRGGK